MENLAVMTVRIHSIPMTRALQSCGNCNAFVPNKADNPRAGEVRTGACCANPPVMMQGLSSVPGSSLGSAGPQMRPVIQGVWPPTDASRWCRTWQSKDEDHEREEFRPA